MDLHKLESSIIVEGFLSLDISKDKLDAMLSRGLSDETVLTSVDRNKKGLKALYRQVKAAGVKQLRVCMEATGSYWKMVAEFFHEIPGTKVYVVNPARIKAQRKTEHKRSKTDKIDTGVIMRFMKANLSLLVVWSPPSNAVRQLQELVRRRDLLVRQRASLKTALQSGDSIPLVKKITERQIESLNEGIEELEAAIEQVICSDDSLKQQAESADSVYGIGLIATAVLLSECRGFREISGPRQATAFAGLDVVIQTSGTISKPPQVSRQGSSLLRKTFVTAAAAAIRKQGPVQEHYQRLRNKGMKRKPALVAAARKLLEITVAIVLKRSKYDVNHRTQAKTA